MRRKFGPPQVFFPALRVPSRIEKVFSIAFRGPKICFFTTLARARTPQADQ